ncbi:hypothetical protein QQX98_012284 [Neonectria punicea]|uniref:Uncharacterized protein n=1 Tax=Neonectria punicea TaxID=979145 RepID=A0ABR1GJD8_9HYPO
MATQAQIEVRLHRKDAEWTQTIQKAVDITVPAFYNDPLFAWMFLEASDELRHKKLWVMIRSVPRSALECGGFILEARDWGSVMAVSEPGQKYDGVRTVWRSDGVSATLSAGLMPTIVSYSPVWLEATTKYSAQQFTRFGFETIDEITVGKGAVNAQGVKQAGGEGVTVTGMIWWPEGAKEK